jgi:hypothetical protein
VIKPVPVSAASDLRKLLASIPSRVSASNPLPEPSFPACHTRLLSINILALVASEIKSIFLLLALAPPPDSDQYCQM